MAHAGKVVVDALRDQRTSQPQSWLVQLLAREPAGAQDPVVERQRRHRLHAAGIDEHQLQDPHAAEQPGDDRVDDHSAGADGRGKDAGFQVQPEGERDGLVLYGSVSSSGSEFVLVI